MSELTARIAHDWSEIPSWAKIGAVAGGAALLLLRRANPSTTAIQSPGSVAGANPLNLAPTTSTGIPVTGGGDTTPTNPLNPTGPTSPSNPVANPQNPVATTGTNPGLSPSQQQLQNQDIQNMLGSYGGTPVAQSNPFAGLGGGWDKVTQTLYSGGGLVTNLGVAQPKPAVGDVIPPAVQGGGFLYPYNYQPGDTLKPGQGTLLDTLNEEQAAGIGNHQTFIESLQSIPPSLYAAVGVTAPQVQQAIQQQQAAIQTDNANQLNLQSKESSAQSTAYQQYAAQSGQGYSAAGQSAFNALHPLSEYA